MAGSLLERKTVNKWTFRVRPADQKNVEQEKQMEKLKTMEKQKKKKRKRTKKMKSEYLEWAGGPSFRPRQR